MRRVDDIIRDRIKYVTYSLIHVLGNYIDLDVISRLNLLHAFESDCRTETQIISMYNQISFINAERG
jgi:hypothetical protein